MAIVDLRGPCHHLAARLDTERRVIEAKCRQCSYERRALVRHWFDVETGEVVEGGDAADGPPLTHPDFEHDPAPTAQ